VGEQAALRKASARKCDASRESGGQRAFARIDMEKAGFGQKMTAL